MPADPSMFLSDASVEAAVTALATRNRHHLESMTEAERGEAMRHWRDLALAVLSAAGAASDADAAGEAGPGRAVIVLEDVDSDAVSVQASFHPDLEDLGGGEIGGTPAQIAALELLDALGADDETQ